jgi:hypothetical protein
MLGCGTDTDRILGQRRPDAIGDRARGVSDGPADERQLDVLLE